MRIEVRSVMVGTEIFTYTDHVFSVPSRAVSEMLHMLERWSACAPYESTYVMNTYKVPSLITRFDGVMDEDGRFHAYEIQGGCGWIGYAGCANPEFRRIRDSLARARWPRFKLLAQPAIAHDDDLWLERVSEDDALRGDDLLMIRGLFCEGRGAHARDVLIERCVKPVFFQNDKRYGESLGLWRRVTREAADSLPWDQGFVLKPIRNHGSVDIMVWNPKERKGRATKTQMVNTLIRHGSMYMQPYIAPTRISLGGVDYNMMIRPFFGFDPKERAWVPMHGVWTARPYPNLRLHGSSDAISGPLMMEA